MGSLAVYYTDKGKRNINQDSMLILKTTIQNESIMFAVICDGVGGLEKGEVASKEVVKALYTWFHNELPKLYKDGISENSLYDSWEKALQKIDQELKRYGQQHELKLGTTVSALLLDDRNYYIAHVGDSRIYEVAEQVSLLTWDQSVSVLSNTGDKNKKFLLQCIGGSEKVKPIYLTGKKCLDVSYLLCSDGFYKKISEDEIKNIFNDEMVVEKSTIEEKLKLTAETIISRGEKDNISAIAIIPYNKEDIQSEIMDIITVADIEKLAEEI